MEMMMSDLPERIKEVRIASYDSFAAIEAMPGLKQSLKASLSTAMTYSEGAFRHDKKPKFK